MKTLSAYKLTVQHSFTTNYGKEEVILKLQSHFDRTLKGLEMRPTFSGLVVSDVDFEIRSKWEMTFYRKPYKKKAYISGHLLPVPDGTTKILLTYRRTQSLSWHLIILFLFPALLIFSGLFIYHDTFVIKAGVMSFIYLGAFYIFGLYYVRRQVIANLAKVLMMKSVNEGTNRVNAKG